MSPTIKSRVEGIKRDDFALLVNNKIEEGKEAAEEENQYEENARREEEEEKKYRTPPRKGSFLDMYPPVYNQQASPDSSVQELELESKTNRPVLMLTARKGFARLYHATDEEIRDEKLGKKTDIMNRKTTVDKLVKMNGSLEAKRLFQTAKPDSLRLPARVDRSIVPLHALDADYGLNEHGIVVSLRNPRRRHPSYTRYDTYIPPTLDRNQTYSRLHVLQFLSNQTSRRRAEFYARARLDQPEYSPENTPIPLNRQWALHATGAVLPINANSASSSSPSFLARVQNILSPNRSNASVELSQPLLPKEPAPIPEYQPVPEEAITSMSGAEAGEASELAGVLEEFATVGSAFI
jgi:hypothetical protein